MIKKSMAVVVWLMIGSLALGAAWTTRRLTNNQSNSLAPAVAVEGSKVYVVWEDNKPGYYEIYLRRSLDGGNSWLAEQRLTFNAGFSANPALAVDGANVCIVWEDDTTANTEIYFRKSTDSGATWQAAKKLTNNAGYSGHPAIAMNGKIIYVVWEDNTSGNREIYLKCSTDGGATWPLTKRLTYSVGTSWDAGVACSGSNVYVIWADSTPGNFDIYFKKSEDGGVTWPISRRLTNNLGASTCPGIAVSGQNVYAVWQDYISSDFEIYFGRSTDGGATWKTAKRLTENLGDSCSPAVAAGDAGVYFVLEDDEVGNFELFFRKSVDYGVTWQTDERLTYNTGASQYSNIAINKAKVFVVWNDTTPGNSEIYLRYSAR